MSFFAKWLDVWSTRNRELRRIADALDRIAPLPTEAVELKPEEAVTYADDLRMAQREQAEEAGQLEQWLAEHAEELEQAEGFGEGDIHARPDKDASD